MSDRDDEEVTLLELQWRLSNVNPNEPRPFPAEPVDGRAESLLVNDVARLEWQIEEWRGIVQAYRDLSQICIEAAARHHQTANRLNKENQALRRLL